jgi:hypothetical protein
MTFNARFFLIPLLLFAPMAQAAQPLIFQNTTNDIRAKSVLTFLETSHKFDPSGGYQIAEIDLNGDQLAEWIVRQDIPQCDRSASCPYYIVGLSNKQPRLLGQIQARKLGMTNQKLYGVSQLVVYNDQRNDFTYKLYSWDPHQGQFSLQ